MKKRYFTVFSILMVSAALALIPGAKSEVKPYYSGDAVNYGGRIIVSSTNTGRLEFFELIAGRIAKEAEIIADDNDYRLFDDVLLMPDSGRLYAFAVNGKYIYKYDVSDWNRISLEKKAMHNDGDRFFGIDRGGNGQIITIGVSGIKVWNTDLETVNQFRADIPFPKSVRFGESGNYIYDATKGSIKIIDAFFRNIVMEASLDVKNGHNRYPFVDEEQGLVFVVDDDKVKKYDFNGYRGSFDHIADFGYDADGIPGRPYFYFSDGIGVVKVRKDDMAAVDWRFTTQLGVDYGWAVGLRAVSAGDREVVIVFNGSSILALDDNLDLIDFYEAVDTTLPAPAPLALTVSEPYVFPQNSIRVAGSGFGYNEAITLELLGAKYYAEANTGGDFTKTIPIPRAKPGTYDLRATGQESGRTYSTTIKILERRDFIN